MKQLTIVYFIVLLLAYPLTVFSAGGKVPLTDVDVPQDEASLQRGFEVYYNICRMCHRLEYVKYQYLSDIGLSKQKIDELRGVNMVNESISATMSDDIATKAFGAVPPDLSLMAKARKNGPRYIYTLLTSYYEKPDGTYDNKLFPGIKMPDPLAYSVASEINKPKLEEDIKNVVAFLTWSADPKADERKEMGVYVIAYLFILSVLFWLIMKRVWSRLPPPISENL